MEKQINVLIADSDIEYAEILSRNISGDFKINGFGVVFAAHNLEDSNRSDNTAELVDSRIVTESGNGL